MSNFSTDQLSGHLFTGEPAQRGRLDPTPFLLLEHAVTVEFWAKSENDLNAATTLLNVTGAQNSEHALFISLPWGGKVHWDTGPGWALRPAKDRLVTDVSKELVPRGVWVHWAFTHDARSGRKCIYRNGELLAENQSARPLQPMFDAYLGWSGQGSDWVGELAMLRIWATSRSAREVHEGMNAVLVDEAGLLAAEWIPAALRPASPGASPAPTPAPAPTPTPEASGIPTPVPTPAPSSGQLTHAPARGSGKSYRWSEAVVASVLAEYGLLDPEALLASAKTLDDGNHYLKRAELEAAARSERDKHARGIASYRFSQHVLADVLADHGLDDQDALLHEAVSHDADHNRYLKRSELEAAAAALTQRSDALTGRRWSERVLAEVAAEHGLESGRALLLEATKLDQHDRYFSRAELEAAARALGGATKPSAWSTVEAFLGPFAFMLRPGASAEEIDGWQEEQGVELTAEVRALISEYSCVELPAIDQSNSSAEAMLLPIAEWRRLDRSGPGLEDPQIVLLLGGISDPKVEEFVLIGENPYDTVYGHFVLLHAPSGAIYKFRLIDAQAEPLGSMTEWISTVRIPDLEGGAAYPPMCRALLEERTGEPGTAASLGESYLEALDSSYAGATRTKRWQAKFPEFQRVFDAIQTSHGPWDTLKSFWGPFAFLAQEGASEAEIRAWEQAQDIELDGSIRQLLSAHSAFEIPSIESPNTSPEVALLPVGEWIRLDRSQLVVDDPQLGEHLGLDAATMSQLVIVGEDPLAVDYGLYVLLLTTSTLLYSLDLRGGAPRYIGPFRDWIAQARMPGIDDGRDYPGLFREKWEALTGEEGSVDALSEEYLQRLSSSLTGAGRATRWTARLAAFRAAFDAIA